MAKTAKQKLIESGIKVFADRGYRDAKIADIVKGANANIAAVNYHFRSKENLFVESLREAFRKADTKYPIQGNLPSSASAEDRLSSAARAILRRSFDRGAAGDFNRIMSKTIHAPGSPVELILKEVRELELNLIEGLMQEQLKNASPIRVKLACLNFISLATVITRHPFISSALVKDLNDNEQIEKFIELQINVILAGSAQLELPE